MNQKVSISGELGSGKTSVAREIAAVTGQRIVSGGDIHRAFAESHGISTVELNLLAERDPEIDDQIDGEWRRLADTDENLIFDSRLAWHFVPTSLAITLIVDSRVAASRLFSGRSSSVEKYADEVEAGLGVFQRQESERRRFLEKYGVDTWRLANYDLVIDTTRADIPTVSSLILKKLGGVELGSRVFVDPRRIYPTERVTVLSRDSDSAQNGIRVVYARPFFAVLEGHDALSKALRSDDSIVPVTVEAEDSEPIPSAGGLTARDYVRGEVNRTWLHDWEDAHGFRFSDYPGDRLART
jgi:cytidylate kinase